MRPPKPVLSKFYPRWIEDRDGAKRMVPNQQQHGAIMLCEYDENAKPLYSPPPTLREAMAAGRGPEEALEFVREEERKAKAHEWPYYVGAPAEKPPTPPTLEEVLRAGYSMEAAVGIVEAEQAAFALGYKPYGNIERPIPFPEPVAAVAQFDAIEAAESLLIENGLGPARPVIEAPPLDFAEVERVLDPAGVMPTSEPLPELPHETELEPVGVAAQPVTDEIEAMFAAKPKRGRKKE